MLKRAIIHIGTEKTGSTSIQEFLHINRKNLEDQGVGYLQSIGLKNQEKLVANCMEKDRTNAFIKRVNIESWHKRHKWKKKLISEFNNELDKVKQQVSTIIISSEHFSSHLKKQSEIMNLKNVLGERFSEIKILIYLRRQDLFLTSLYSSICKAGFAHIEIFHETQVKRDFLYYQLMLENWSKIFGVENIIIRVFEHEKFIEQNLLKDFMYYTGIQNSRELMIPEKINDSISETAQLVAYYFNKHFPKDINNQPDEATRKFRHALIEKINIAFPGPGKKPLRSEAIKIYQRFEKSNSIIAYKWLNREKLFSEDFSMYPVEHLNNIYNQKLLDTIFSAFSENFLSTK